MSIIKEEAYFKSTTGQDQIRTLIWHEEEKSPIAILQIAHGENEHMDRYEELATFFAKNGILVCGNDHIGHGKSFLSNENKGKLPSDASDRIIDDINRLYKIMRKKYENLPYFMLGYSLGASCVREFMSLFGENLAGVILCGAIEFPGGFDLVEKPLKSLVEIIDPSKSSDGLMKIMDKILNIGNKDKKSQNDWISFSEENLQSIKEDPLYVESPTFGMLRDFFIITSKVSTNSWYNNVPDSLPTLLLSGVDDPLGLYGIGIQAISQSLENTGKDQQMVMFPECKHDILHEENREMVFYTILQFIFEAAYLKESGDNPEAFFAQLNGLDR